MKKRLLVFLSFTPMLLASCNKNSSLSFDNPFPKDPYSKIGFNLPSDEIGKLSLSSDEITLVNKTVADSTKYDQFIHHCKIESHERDYTRAFAGVFKQGYQCSNSMIDTYSDIYFREENGKTQRSWSIDKTDKTLDYEYGQSSSTLKTATFNYFGTGDNNKIKESLGIDTANRIATQTNDYTSTSTLTNVLSSDVIAWKDGENWTDKSKSTFTPENAFYIRQNKNNLLFNTSECTVPALATEGSTRRVILIKETKEKHGDKGRFILNDGKEFLSMDNSLTVTQLVKKSSTMGDFYLIESSRKYIETTITSEQIEINAEIKMLNNPLTIKYSETKYKFELNPSSYELDTATMNEINDKEQTTL